MTPPVSYLVPVTELGVVDLTKKAINPCGHGRECSTLELWALSRLLAAQVGELGCRHQQARTREKRGGRGAGGTERRAYDTTTRHGGG